MKPLTAQIVIAFVFGVTFVVALIVLAIQFPRPTPFQYNVFRIVLSLAAAGAAAMIPGFINIEVSATTGLLIRAGGALAVFVIVFFFNPAQLAVQSETTKDEDGSNEHVGGNPLPESSQEVLRIAVLLPDMAFAKVVRDSFRQTLITHFPKADIIEFIGPTNAKGKEAADLYWSQKVQEVLRRHKARPYHYLVPIGTQAAEKLSQALGEDYGKQPFLFLGVSDPVRAGLVASLTARSDSHRVSGVAYGSGIEDVVSIIHRLFPTNPLIYVYDPTPGLYTQDIAMAERLKATQLYRQGKVQTLEIIGFPKLSDLPATNSVYFSWYVLETMFETGLGKDLLDSRVIVASTEKNVSPDGLACVGVAPDDSEIGTTGAELIVQNKIHGQRLETMDIVTPKNHYWVNTETANRLGIEFSPDVLKGAHRLFP